MACKIEMASYLCWARGIVACPDDVECIQVVRCLLVKDLYWNMHFVPGSLPRLYEDSTDFWVWSELVGLSCYEVQVKVETLPVHGIASHVSSRHLNRYQMPSYLLVASTECVYFPVCAANGAGYPEPSESIGLGDFHEGNHVLLTRLVLITSGKEVIILIVDNTVHFESNLCF